MTLVLRLNKTFSGKYYSIAGIEDFRNDSLSLMSYLSVLLQEYNIIAGDISISNKEQNKKLNNILKDIKKLGVKIVKLKTREKV